LAGVLAHEIVHVYKYHGLQDARFRKQADGGILGGVMASFGVAIGGMTGLFMEILGEISANHAFRAAIAGYNRELEREADVEGMSLFVTAGYNGREMINAFQRLSLLEGNKRSFYSDHPRTEKRMAYLVEHLETLAVDSLSHDATPGRETYQIRIAAAVRHNIRQALTYRQFHLALFFAAKMDTTGAPEPDRLVLLGDVFRSLGPRSPTPTKADREAWRNMSKTMTWNEEDAALMKTRSGRQAWEANRDLAETFYNRALALDAEYAYAYRGLGFLYEQDAKPGQAVEAYRRYMALKSYGLDRVQIKNRIEALDPEK